jgi:hypothetical protein
LDDLQSQFDAQTIVGQNYMYWKGFCKFFEAVFPNLKGRHDIAERIWLVSVWFFFFFFFLKKMRLL